MKKNAKPVVPAIRSWLVIATRNAKYEVVTKPCTREEAERNPFAVAEALTDMDTIDWEVEAIEPNE